MGYYQVFMGADGVFDRPIVLVDGMDTDDGTPGGIRKMPDLYGRYSRYGLADELREVGYDIVLFDYDDGSDYIQNNAYALVRLLAFVRSKVVGSEGVTLGGPSMGGLVARYAVGAAASRGIDVGVDHLILFDTPNRGAHIPLTVQALIRDEYGMDPLMLTNISWPLVEFVLSPASKEMLLQHSNVGYENPAPDPLFYEFFAELNGLPNRGYVQDGRNVAVINGTVDGVTDWYGNRRGIAQVHAPNQPGATHGLTMMNGGEYAAKIGAPWGYIHLVSYPWSAYQNPPNCCMLYYRVNNMAGGASQRYGISVTPSSAAIDHAAGGYYEIYQELEQQMPPSVFSSVVYTPNANFVPTYSALDYPTDNPHFPVGDDASFRDRIPFDAIHYPRNANEEHAYVSLSAKDFVFQEIVLSDTAPISDRRAE